MNNRIRYGKDFKSFPLFRFGLSQMQLKARRCSGFRPDHQNPTVYLLINAIIEGIKSSCI